MCYQPQCSFIFGLPSDRLDIGMGDRHRPITRYVKLWVALVPIMPGTFSPPPISKETASLWSLHASRHVRHARAMMRAGIANPRWWGKCSRHPWHMCNTQFYVSDNGPFRPLWPGTETINHANTGLALWRRRYVLCGQVVRGRNASRESWNSVIGKYWKQASL